MVLRENIDIRTTVRHYRQMFYMWWKMLDVLYVDDRHLIASTLKIKDENQNSTQSLVILRLLSNDRPIENSQKSPASLSALQITEEPF
jgi:hypothetical protein